MVQYIVHADILIYVNMKGNKTMGDHDSHN